MSGDNGNDGLGYLSVIPGCVPDGQVVVHNSVRPTRRLGSRGFRAWREAAPPRDALKPCGCGWVPEFGAHYPRAPS